MKQVLGDRYEVKQQLSRKAGRQTLLALDRETGEQVIVKLLTFDAEFEWEALKLFERETLILQTLQHPHIPGYLNSFELDQEHNKGLALVQTYIEAPSLESHLKAGRKFSEIEIKQIAESLLETLIYLHSHNPSIIHRDIKPSNVLLTNRSGNYVGKVYLVDFGSVQTVASQNSGTFTVVGTYGYMPPEQFSGKTTPVSDLYSLGAMLIYLVTGKHPADLMTDDLQLEFGELTTLSLELTRWLQQMVQITPSKRFANANAALQELKNPQFQDLGLPLTKPIGSRINIEHHNHKMCIQLPYNYLNSRAWLNKLVFISTGVVGLLLFVMIFTNSPWYIAPWLMFMYLFMYLGKVGNIHSSKILIDDQKISFQTFFMNFKLNKKSYRREDIYRLDFGEQSLSSSSGSTTSRKNREYQLIINMGVKPYLIKAKNEIEISWLAQELSRYLNLPLNPLSKPAELPNQANPAKDLSLRESFFKIIPKPPSSKVRLLNTEQVLEMIIPPQGFHPSLIFLILLATVMGLVGFAFLIPLLVLIGAAISSKLLGAVAISILGLIFTSSISFVILWTTYHLCYDILLTLFGVVILNINHSEITLSKKIFGFICSPILRAARPDITKVEITPLSYRENYEREQEKVLPKINIWAGTQKFELADGSRLTAQELEWMAQNLSIWLDMPITKE